MLKSFELALQSANTIKRFQKSKQKFPDIKSPDDLKKVVIMKDGSLMDIDEWTNTPYRVADDTEDAEFEIIEPKQITMATKKEQPKKSDLDKAYEIFVARAYAENRIYIRDMVRENLNNYIISGDSPEEAVRKLFNNAP